MKRSKKIAVERRSVNNKKTSGTPRVAFTGHRPGRLNTFRVRGCIKELVGRIISKRPETIFIDGGASGVDLWAAQEVIGQGGRLNFILPFHPDRGNLWRGSNYTTLKNLMARASSIEIIGDRYNVKYFYMRNRRMVEKADALIAFWDGKRYGGTWNTIKLAWCKKIPVWDGIRNKLLKDRQLRLGIGILDPREGYGIVE